MKWFLILGGAAVVFGACLFVRKRLVFDRWEPSRLDRLRGILHEEVGS